VLLLFQKRYSQDGRDWLDKITRYDQLRNLLNDQTGLRETLEHVSNGLSQWYKAEQLTHTTTSSEPAVADTSKKRRLSTMIIHVSSSPVRSKGKAMGLGMAQHNIMKLPAQKWCAVCSKRTDDGHHAGRMTTHACVTCGTSDEKSGTVVPVPVCVTLPQKNSIYHGKWKITCEKVLHHASYTKNQLKQAIEARQKLTHTVYCEQDSTKKEMNREKTKRARSAPPAAPSQQKSRSSKRKKK
jgi:hypothetical protein